MIKAIVNNIVATVFSLMFEADVTGEKTLTLSKSIINSYHINLSCVRILTRKLTEYVERCYRKKHSQHQQRAALLDSLSRLSICIN